nr:glycosyltransferase [Lachnospiraceae bacterium]
MDKILFLEWKSFGNDYIIREFEKCDYEVILFPFPRETEDVRSSKELTEKLASIIMQEKPAFVFSFNYFPVAAIACKACRIKYVSWVYDSPYILMYSQTVFYETNRIFVFDQAEVLKFRQMGVKNIYYMPMAAAVEDYDAMIPEEAEHIQYDSDVTFIGSMYSETRQHMFRHLEKLDDYTRGYLFGLMGAQKNIYGMDILEEALTPEIVETMRKVCPVTEHGDGLETVEWVFANYFLARKVTAMERQEILERLSQKHEVRLFTPEQTPTLTRVKNMGKLDYYTQAPYAIKCAKINLNISLRSIHTGMPLRALDIFACGGFLLTNFQSDFLEYFEPGVDFVYYESIADAERLVAYYLEHDDERKQIAENGYRKVREYLSYEKQVSKLLGLI